MRRKVHATGPAVAAPAAVPASPDWASEAVDRIDQLVDKVRSNTTDRLVKVARLLVFGLLAAVMGIAAAVLFTIAAVRALDELIPGPVWGVYLLLGAIFVLGGVFLWGKRKQKAPSDAGEDRP